MCYYFLCISLPCWDWFFSNWSTSYTRSNSLADPFLGRILLQARRKYTYFSSTGWHHSLHNHQYHYTLRGYNTSGWMMVTLEMGTSGRTKVFTYGHKHWMIWSSNSRGGSLHPKYFFNSKDHEEIFDFKCRLMYTTVYLEGILDLGP
ncbi:hypothetical protein EDD18DRAFT_1107505 [Armillaria luteobubalina]|uniref:Uncharacterized protein n=1 Tax=Armillaria luteobubalina TaxID=153913 RepID=A0AA39Q0H8_9AGAR|nr:hypothetical protein EDD18DRAFT_1107505 [Armillaria luteobubalina]